MKDMKEKTEADKTRAVAEEAFKMAVESSLSKAEGEIRNASANGLFECEYRCGSHKIASEVAAKLRNKGFQTHAASSTVLSWTKGKTVENIVRISW